MMSPGRARVLVVAALVAGVAGCRDARASSARVPARHTVEIRAFRFVPDTLRVAAGDTVVFINRDAVPHTATASAGGFDTGDVAAGAARPVAVRKQGVLPYICAYHPSMEGRLEVR